MFRLKSALSTSRFIIYLSFTFGTNCILYHQGEVLYSLKLEQCPFANDFFLHLVALSSKAFGSV